jgi:hypothetical protein
VEKMVKQIIVSGENAQKEFNISEYTSVTILNRGGTSNTVISLSADGTNFVQKASVAADTITTVTDNAVMLRVAPGTGATYDVVGELR